MSTDENKKEFIIYYDFNPSADNPVEKKKAEEIKAAFTTFQDLMILNLPENTYLSIKDNINGSSVRSVVIKSHISENEIIEIVKDGLRQSGLVGKIVEPL